MSRHSDRSSNYARTTAPACSPSSSSSVPLAMPTQVAPSSRARPSSSTSSPRRPSRMPHLWRVSAVAILASLASLSTVVRAAAFEPPGNQVLFGAWIDTADGFNDRPASYNQRLGLNVPVFQISQVIPRLPYNWTSGAGGPAPENLIELSNTTAAVFLTIYPSLGFAPVTNDDYTILGEQVLAYQQNNRTVFLRYAPEMQGQWNLYGQQPTAFVASWRQMYTTVKTIAPETIVVWAPNEAQGYPYGQNFQARTNFAAASAADIALLDTNHNGQLDAGDDAFSPYYPGDSYVDWIGISLYYKGTAASDMTNIAQSPGFCSLAINGTNPTTGDDISNWYTTYCEQKPEVACMFAESGAAYHPEDAAGDATQLQIQTSWINDCITNSSMLDAFPRLKLIMHFEYEKTENSNTNQPDLRDYRLTNSSDVLAVLQQGFSSIGTRYSWADYRAPPTSISTPGAAAPTTNSAGSTIVQAITQTTRARPTTFPSLFGRTSDGTQLAEFLEIGVLVSCGLFGAWATMRWA